jgi:hypothetical protein
MAKIEVECRKLDVPADDSDAALLASIMRTDREGHRRLRPNLALTQQLLAQVWLRFD